MPIFIYNASSIKIQEAMNKICTLRSRSDTSMKSGCYHWENKRWYNFFFEVDDPLWYSKHWNYGDFLNSKRVKTEDLKTIKW